MSYVFGDDEKRPDFDDLRVRNKKQRQADYRKSMREREKELFPHRLYPEDPLYPAIVRAQMGPAGDIPYGDEPSVVDPAVATHHPRLVDKPSFLNLHGAYHAGGRRSHTAEGKVAPDDTVPLRVYPQAKGGVVNTLWNELRKNYYTTHMKPDTLHTWGKGGKDTVVAHEFRHRLDPMVDEIENRRHDMLNAKNWRQWNDINDINASAFGEEAAKELRDELDDPKVRNRLLKWEYDQGARTSLSGDPRAQSLGAYISNRELVLRKFK